MGGISKKVQFDLAIIWHRECIFRYLIVFVVSFAAEKIDLMNLINSMSNIK